MAKIKKIKLPNNSVYDLADSRIPGIDTEVTSGSNNLITSGAVQNALNSIVVPESMKYKGTVGTGGTITTLPAATTNNSGDTYKVITDGTYQSIAAKIGDVFISNGETWTLIPSGDEPSGTVTNIATGTGLTGGPITTTGTISIDTDVVAMKSEIPSAVTESTVAGWGFTKNAGTITGVKFNGASASVSGGVASITATIPAAPGTLITNATAAQTASAGEAMSGSITLHKIAKTGTYSDLIGTPTIPTNTNQLTNGAGFITGITSSMISTALGYTPANSTSLSGYLPLTGGTLSGSTGAPLNINSTNNVETAITFQRNGTTKAWIGYADEVGVYLYNCARNRYLNYKDDGSLLFEGNQVWHAGNDGASSGLDADLLDGYHASTNQVGNTIALRTNNGYINASYFNQGSSIGETPSGDSAWIFCNSDGYFRKATRNSLETLLQPYEARLQWGGGNHYSSFGPIDAAMVPELGACRTMFVNGDAIDVQYSTDGGVTWTDYGATKAQKQALFSSGSTFTLKPNISVGTDYTNYQLRIILNTAAASVYTQLNKFVIYLSSSGSQGSWCTIDGRIQDNVNSGTDTWDVFANKIDVGGWSGYNVINTSAITTYGNTAAYQYGQIRFTFGNIGYSTSYPGLHVYKIYCFGGVGWETPSTMAKTGLLYSFDQDQNAFFPSEIYVNGGANRLAKITEIPTSLTTAEIDAIITAEDS